MATGETIYRLKPSDIYYFEAVDNKVFIYCRDKVYESRQKLYELEQLLNNKKFTGEYRNVTVEFWYPTNAEGKFPLVIFSHGAFGIRMSNTSTYMELASNGYVVCSIDHPYHAAGTVDTNGKLTIGSQKFIQEVVDANGDVYGDEEQFALYQNWMSVRTGDISFVLETILKNNHLSESVYGLVDAKKVGLMGHSLERQAHSLVVTARILMRLLTLTEPCLANILALKMERL